VTEENFVEETNKADMEEEEETLMIREILEKKTK
jgi:hypothetical protein